MANWASRIRRRVGRIFQGARNLFRRGQQPPEVDKAEASRRFETAKERFNAGLERWTDELVQGRMTPKVWGDVFFAALRDVFTTATVAGSGGLDHVDKDDIDAMDRELARQKRYLTGFQAELERLTPEELASRRGQIITRGRMYPDAAKKLLDRAESTTYSIPELPFYPADDTLCMNNCKCRWRFKVVDRESGNFDCYWTLGDAEHCQVCINRAEDAKPLRVRGGVVTGDWSDPRYYASRGYKGIPIPLSPPVINVPEGVKTFYWPPLPEGGAEPETAPEAVAEVVT